MNVNLRARRGIVFWVNEKDISVTTNRNESQQRKSEFLPSPKRINEERWDDKKLHVDRQVPGLTHTLSPNILKHYLPFRNSSLNFWNSTE